jgi:hypothetical protein
MFGKKSHVSPLELKKRLLIAESEINRSQMIQEWQTMADEVHALAQQARTVRSLVGAAASLSAGLAAFWRSKSVPADEKPSWWQTILKGAQLAGSIWSQLRTRPKS